MNPDIKRRDTEQNSSLEEGGVEGCLRLEVLAYAKDAWQVTASVNVGNETNSNRHAYKPEPTRTLHEVDTDVAVAERQAEELHGGCLQGSAA